MPSLARKTHKIFGNAGTTDNFVQFGSTVGPGADSTKDIPTIQALTAWDNGWQQAVFAGDRAPVMQEMNAWCYEHSYQMACIFEEGIPKWDSGTTYFIGSIVTKPGTSPVEEYESLQDNNLNNALPSQTDNAFWRFRNPQLSGTTNYVAKFIGARTLGPTVSQIWDDPGGNVGIGTTTPTSKLTVQGLIESKTGGVKFPDGSVQATAGFAITPGIILQQVANIDGSQISGNSVMSYALGAPQNTQGSQVITQTITPKSATSKLVIRYNGMIELNGSGSAIIALFKDSEVTARGCTRCSAVGTPDAATLTYQMIAGSTAPITFAVRVGSQLGGSYFVNQDDLNHNGGGTTFSTLEVIEIAQ